MPNIVNLLGKIYDVQNCQSLQRQFLQTFPNTSVLTLTNIENVNSQLEEEDNIIVKWAQEYVEILYSTYC